MIKFILGAFVGSIITVFTMALCQVASDADRHMELMDELKGDEKDDTV